MSRGTFKAVLLLVGVTALTLKAQAPQDSRGIAGVWATTLQVGTAGRADRIDRIVGGQIALLAAGSRQVEPAQRSPATHVGVHSLRLEPLGVESLLPDRLSVVASQSADGASVLVVISPGRDHGSMVLRGTVHGDSITGSWYVTAYAAGPHGTFVMRRVANS